MPSNSQSATIDLNTGKMYWAAINNKLQSALYEVNLDNGKASLVSDYDETVVLLGLYTVPPAAAHQAPAAVDKLSVNYTSPERLDANITFTAPDKTFEGDKLEGSLPEPNFPHLTPLRKARTKWKPSYRTPKVTV